MGREAAPGRPDSLTVSSLPVSGGGGGRCPAGGEGGSGEGQGKGVDEGEWVGVEGKVAP